MFTLKCCYTAPRFVALGTKFYCVEDICGTPQNVEYVVRKVEWVTRDDTVRVWFVAESDESCIRFSSDDIQNNCVKVLQQGPEEEYYFKILYFKNDKENAV